MIDKFNTAGDVGVNSCLVGSLTFIKTLSPGTMIFDAVEVVPSKIELVFLIKETQLHFDELIKGNPEIDMRSSLLAFNSVALTSLLIRVNNNPNMTYQMFFNYHEAESVKQYFDYLATEDKLNLLFLTNNFAQFVSVNNSLQLGFKLHLRQLKNRVPWSIGDFERAKSELLKIYPTANSLWDGLKRNAERIER